jgi:hypothetical protein
MLQQPVSFSRRRTSRVETPEGVWVYWGCGRRDDTSRVRNLSLVVYSSKPAGKMSWVQMHDLSFSSRNGKSEPRPSCDM